MGNFIPGLGSKSIVHQQNIVLNKLNFNGQGTYINSCYRLNVYLYNFYILKLTKTKLVFVWKNKIRLMDFVLNRIMLLYTYIKHLLGLVLVCYICFSGQQSN